MGTFDKDMEAARKVETGESSKPVIVKLTGRMDNPQITNETIAEKPIDVINRLSGRDKPVPLSGLQLTCLNEMESMFEGFVQEMFAELYSSNMDEDEMGEVVDQFIARLSIKDEWDSYVDNVDDEVPGQDERDYPQSFLE